MFKQIILPILGVMAFIIVVGLYVQKGSTLNIPGATGKTVTIGSKVINVEVAKTKDARAKGLSGKSNLDTNSGMLFIFDSQNVSPGFWMKDMLISIDIIWINDGKVTKIDKNVPVPTPGTLDKDLKVYSPGQAIDYVLEVNAGYSDKNDIKVGDSVNINL